MTDSMNLSKSFIYVKDLDKFMESVIKIFLNFWFYKSHTGLESFIFMKSIIQVFWIPS